MILFTQKALIIEGKGGNNMAKAFPQKVAEAVLKKSFSHIPLKPGETPQDNPFLAERRGSIPLQPLKTKPKVEDSDNRDSRKP